MTATLTATPYCDKYFGGVENVCRRLRDALSKSASAKSYPSRYIDGICGFGTILPKRKIRLPKFDELMDTPEKNMTSLAFSLASSLLDLDISKTLPVAVTESDRVEIAKEMKSKPVMLKGSGGENASDLPLEGQATVYVISRVLSEVDQHSSLSQTA